MRFSAAILLNIMLVFFTLPLMHISLKTKKGTCKATVCANMCPLRAKNNNDNNNSCNSSCNPLVNCPFCQYVMAEIFSVLDMELPVSNEVNIPKNENALFTYNKACWHPPEMI